MNMYANQMYQGMNPYQQPQFNNFYNQNQNLPKSQLLKVTGIEGAQAYQMASDSQVPLFDANENIMYIKTTDSAGFPTIRKFSFMELVDSQKSIDTDNFISRDEFNNFKNEVMNYAKQFISVNKQINTTESTNDSTSKKHNE